MSEQCKVTMDLYNMNSTKLKIEELSRGTATRPSVSSMLEWINDLDQLYYELYPYGINKSTKMKFSTCNNDDIRVK